MAIAKYAFEFALLNNRKKVTAVHKVYMHRIGRLLYMSAAS